MISKRQAIGLAKYMGVSMAFAAAVSIVANSDLSLPNDHRPQIEQQVKARVAKMPEGFSDVVITSFNKEAGKPAHLTFDAKLKTDAGTVPYKGEADCTRKNCSLIKLALK